MVKREQELTFDMCKVFIHIPNHSLSNIKDYIFFFISISNNQNKEIREECKIITIFFF